MALQDQSDFITVNIRNSSVWQPPQASWLKWNTDAFRVEKKQSMMISYVCRDSMGSIVLATTKIWDYMFLLAETLAI